VANEDSAPIVVLCKIFATATLPLVKMKHEAARPPPPPDAKRRMHANKNTDADFLSMLLMPLTT